MLPDKSLLGKIRVFLLSLSPRLDRAGEAMASAHLAPAEAVLFQGMSRYDRAHSLLVAGRLAGDSMLVKSALLHDTGKLPAELPLWFRTSYTAAEIFVPQHLKRTEQRLDTRVGEGTSREKLSRLRRSSDRALFVQMYHGEIAADYLTGLGCELEVVEIVRYHQGVPGPEDEALQRFIRADSAF